MMTGRSLQAGALCLVPASIWFLFSLAQRLGCELPPLRDSLVGGLVALALALLCPVVAFFYGLDAYRAGAPRRLALAVSAGGVVMIAANLVV